MTKFLDLMTLSSQLSLKRLFQQTEERRLDGSMFRQNRVKLEEFAQGQRGGGETTSFLYLNMLSNILEATIQAFQRILDEQAENPIDNPDWNDLNAYLAPIFEHINPNQYDLLQDPDSEIYLLTAFILAHTFPGNQISVDGIVNTTRLYGELAKTIATTIMHYEHLEFRQLIQSYLKVLTIKKEANY